MRAIGDDMTMTMTGSSVSGLDGGHDAHLRMEKGEGAFLLQGRPYSSQWQRR